MKMDMQHMLELLLANQKKAKADKERDRVELKVDRDELKGIMTAFQEKNVLQPGEGGQTRGDAG
jgi:hypothetical protein